MSTTTKLFYISGIILFVLLFGEMLYEKYRVKPSQSSFGVLAIQNSKVTVELINGDTITGTNFYQDFYGIGRGTSDDLVGMFHITTDDGDTLINPEKVLRIDFQHAK